MEEDRKERKERRTSERQVFYFNEKGQLIVESNKGVWVDGERFVKMYGDFTCNAKTLGIIINKFNGFPVVVQETRLKDSSYLPISLNTLSSTAIVNPTDEDKELISKIEKYEIRNENMVAQVNDLKETIKEKARLAEKCFLAIDRFNRLPWWKRMFKKLEVK